MSASGSRKIDGKIAAARLAIGFERVWTALLWPMLVAATLFSLIFSGLLPALPVAARVVIVLALSLAFLWSLKSLVRLVWPSRHAAMRRIEAQSQLAHRPVSAHDDRLAKDGAADPLQLSIWQEHKLRQLRQLETLRVGQPRSTWRDLDGRALRVPAALALLASVILGQGSLSGNFRDSFAVAPRAVAQGIALDAWLKPPTYTGKAPIMLTSPAMVERLKTDKEIIVPENSMLALRLSSAGEPRVTFHDGADANAPEITGLASTSKSTGGVFQSETRLTRPAFVKVMDGGTEIASWRITLRADLPPTVAVTEEPKGDSSGTLTVKWKAADDYGVTGIVAEFSLSDTQDDGLGIDGNGIFLYDAPKFPISLRKASPKEEAASTSADLTEHPWAGFMVELALEATDAAGHKTLSGISRFRLPERLFVKPLAKALMEQRRHLILKPDEQGQVAEMLKALLAYPEGLIDGSGDYLAIATIVSRLKAAADQDDVDVAVNMLWRTAVGIEDGNMANARAELEALRRELEKALAEGASPERIAELMDKLRGAMDRYMQSLMQEMDKRMREGSVAQNQQQPGQTISPEDLRKMLDMIEQLAQSGANDAAKEMLSQLDEILRNLQPGMQQGQMQRETPLSKMLDQLSELMRKQQGLMDDTQRMRQPGDGDETDPQGRDSGRPGQRFSPDALAGEQQDLTGLLEEMLRQLGQEGLDAPPSLGEAGKNMEGAEGSLRNGDREGALGEQGEAMAKLREGAQGMAQQLLQQGQGQQGSYGRHGEARGENHDPLGRPMPYHGEDRGPDADMLPTELAIRRAREILDMLRARAGEQQAPKLERDYIDRLLRGLY
ncbi:MAG: TIGR02302 family protein [Rhizobiales bacterium]|nr:TIGR02302 family protein [Hyphomicrobiales bacterium]